MIADAAPCEPKAVLLAGAFLDNVLAALELFHDAGFAVDVISPLAGFGLSRRVRRFIRARRPADILALLRAELGGGYAVIVACEDEILRDIRDSDWTDAEKLTALPVTRLEDADHLFSKIGLSRRLERGGVATPPYYIARDPHELAGALGAMVLPAMVKLDASGGGFGVFPVEGPADIDRLAALPPRFPVLVQQRIHGVTMSAEVFYRAGAPVFFTYAEFLDTTHGPFGPSALRRYRPRTRIDPGVIEELGALGRALGANGFANVSLIETEAGERFYFEADLRPNAWVAVGRHIGEDPAGRIRDAFGAAAPSGARAAMPARPRSGPILHFNRASLLALLVNRHGVWSTLPRGEGPALLALLIVRAASRRVASFCAAALKGMLSERRYDAARGFYRGMARQLDRVLGAVTASGTTHGQTTDELGQENIRSDV